MLRFWFLSAALAAMTAMGVNNYPTAAQAEAKEKVEAPKAAPKEMNTKERAAYLQDISVTIHAANAQGSGMIKTRDGVSYVWTAAHVVSRLRTTRQVIDHTSGATKTIVEFDDAKVVKELREDGRAVGRVEMDAEVVRYSDADNGDDLALLRVRKKNFVKASVDFYLEKDIPDLGTDLFHCGSLMGQVGSNSITKGILSQQGRVLNGMVYDQTTCAAFRGSSGGGVYLADGRFVGMIVRGAGETFNLIVPVRRVNEWAKKNGIEFAVNDAVAVPNDEALFKLGVEDVGARLHGNSGGRAMPKNMRFMINDGTVDDLSHPSLRLRLEIGR